MRLAKIKFVQFLPANPGFHVLTAADDDNGNPVEVFQAPIVAWALEESSLCPYPVTLEGVETANVHILRPDGAVEQPWHGLSLSVDEWLKSRQDEHRAKKRNIP